MTATTITDRASRLRTRLARASDIEGSMLAMGALTGLLTGLLASGLILGIRLLQPLLWGGDVLWWELLLLPTAGAFVVGLLVTYVVPEASGSGIVRTMETLAVRGGRFRRRVPLAGLAATTVALSAGASGGREGPIALMGGATGSLVGQLFRLDEDRMKSMVGAGVAAGIGASFNAPIGGMLFAIELILGRMRARSLQVVVVSSVVGSVTARQLVGSGVTFDLPVDYQFSDPWHLLGYAVLGLSAAGLGLAFVRGEAAAFRMFTWLRRRLWRPLTLAIGGLGVGIIALFVPEVLGTGDALPPIEGLIDPVHALLTRDLDVGWAAIGVLAALLVAKFAATMLTIGSGSAVGTFAPTLFTGAALGAMVGIAADTIVPSAGLDPRAFALVGMAAGFSAAARAPLTSIIIVFELTGDYGMVLPLMLSCGVATWLADRWEPDSVYTHPLHERGIVPGELDDIDVLQVVTAGEAMTPDHPSLLDVQPWEEVVDLFERTGSHGFAVVDGGNRLVGVVTRSDVEDAERHPLVRSGRRRVSQLTALDLATQRPVAVHPDDPVHNAVHRMAALDIGRVPVIERRSRRLVGIVRRGDVVGAYQQGLNRHLGDQQRRATRSLRDLAGVSFVEERVAEGSLADGNRVREVAWPARTIVTTIRRGGEVVMPTGDTRFSPGDVVVVLADNASRGTVRHLLTVPSRDGYDPTDPAQQDGVADDEATVE
ncbi:chloride channel protein [Salsipaludibacter albus]|uniref:chloride channel protein n=1 Tax=Salsipaludibacter albus TaxID=2849650 RepID=UPI001EE3C343|nr:chloride channel protein [Salsipaludibacter albus]MBY5161613.1 chloride channel protein [Salsipaludibacter albus]